MKISLLLMVCIAIACKPQQNTSSDTTLELVDEYQPNPDEVILQLKFTESNSTEQGWINKVEVVRQLKAGFGYKNRLQPGESISLSSKEEIPKGEFFCAAEYQISPSGGSFRLISILKK